MRGIRRLPAILADSGDATAADESVANAGIMGDVSIEKHDHHHYYAPGNGRPIFREGLQPSKEVVPEPDLAAVQSKFRRYVQNELRTLGDWGLMHVPWRRVDNHDQITFASDEALKNEPDLAAHVASGGRLVIVGPSQSGKTTLAVRLMSLLDEYSDYQPVLFRLHTWVPTQQPLTMWISSALRNEYGLHGDAHRSAIDDIRRGHIVPIFDGLDELAESSLVLAAQALRQFTNSSPAVLTGIYTDRNAFAFDTALPGAHVIALDPVTTDEVGRYLLLEIPKAAKLPWEEIAAGLKGPHGAAARTALSTPLNAWLAKAVYVGSGRRVSYVTELLKRLSTPGDIEQHLLGNVVRAVFSRRAARLEDEDPPFKPDGTSHNKRKLYRRFIAEEAEVWLGFLSRNATSRAIAFWELRGYAPLYRIAVTAVALLAVAAGIGGNFLSVAPGSFFILLLAGIVFGFGYSRGYSIGRWKAPDDPTRLGYTLAPDSVTPNDTSMTRIRPMLPKDGDLRDHSRKLAKGLGLATIFYVVSVGHQWWYQRSADWRLGLSERQFWAAVVMATAVAVSIGHLGGRISARVLRSMSSLDAATGARTAHPLEVIRNDRRSGIGMLVLACIVFCAGYGIYLVMFRPPGGLWGLAAVPIGSAAAMFFWNQWAPFKAAHLWLYLRDRLPLHLQDFLHACHEYGLLRQNGNHFTFRHQRIQDCLATRYERWLRDRSS